MEHVVLAVEVHDAVLEVKPPLVPRPGDLVVLTHDHVGRVEEVGGVFVRDVVAGAQGLVVGAVFHVVLVVGVQIVVVVIVVVVVVIVIVLIDVFVVVGRVVGAVQLSELTPSTPKPLPALQWRFRSLAFQFGQPERLKFVQHVVGYGPVDAGPPEVLDDVVDDLTLDVGSRFVEKRVGLELFRIEEALAPGQELRYTACASCASLSHNFKLKETKNVFGVRFCFPEKAKLEKNIYAMRYLRRGVLSIEDHNTAK